MLMHKESEVNDVVSFADESGISKGSPCYTIGILNVPSEYLDEFNFCFQGSPIALYRKSAIVFFKPEVPALGLLYPPLSVCPFVRPFIRPKSQFQ